ncbi:MAG: D-2-hydroxyacid dehydrogenase [Oscillospiraceae bacterium]
MLKVLASDGLENSAVQQLETLGYEVERKFYEPEDLAKAVQNCDVLVVRSATKVRVPTIDAAAAAGRLKLIIRAGVGTDNIDVAYAREKGIAVNNAPSASSASVAELAIGHMFSIARHIYIANVTMREGKWEKKKYEGIELAGKTLGVVGMGRIGHCVAQKAHALGMNVIYNSATKRETIDGLFPYVPLEELLARCDFVSLHVPKTDKPILGAEEIAKMKDGAYVVNTGRGNLLDEEALMDALDSGKLSAAALDVFAEEPTKNERLYTHPKISLTPHVGASSAEAQTRIGEEVVTVITNHFA